MQAFYATKTAAIKNPEAEFVAIFSAGIAGNPRPITNIGSYFTEAGRHGVYSNLEIEKVVGEGMSTLDDTKRAALAKKGVKILYDDVAFIPIFN